jgi:hypothetical protein
MRFRDWDYCYPYNILFLSGIPVVQVQREPAAMDYGKMMLDRWHGLRYAFHAKNIAQETRENSFSIFFFRVFRVFCGPSIIYP